MRQTIQKTILIPFMVSNVRNQKGILQKELILPGNLFKSNDNRTVCHFDGVEITHNSTKIGDSACGNSSVISPPSK